MTHKRQNDSQSSQLTFYRDLLLSLPLNPFIWTVTASLMYERDRFVFNRLSVTKKSGARQVAYHSHYWQPSELLLGAWIALKCYIVMNCFLHIILTFSVGIPFRVHAIIQAGRVMEEISRQLHVSDGKTVGDCDAILVSSPGNIDSQHCSSALN